MNLDDLMLIADEDREKRIVVKTVNDVELIVYAAINEYNKIVLYIDDETLRVKDETIQ